VAESLLPPSGTGLFEKTFEASAFPRWDSFDVSADFIRGLKYSAEMPATFKPFIIYEYGLDVLRPFVPNLDDLVDEAVRWQRLRGTTRSIEVALGWIGYSATIVQQSPTRNWWNSFQLYFTDLPRYDFPDLVQIEGVVDLSVPVRSMFRRGVHGYDVTALVEDNGRLDGSLLDFESGTTYADGDTLWSFGRLTEIEHVLEEDEGVAIGNWLAETGDGGIPWVSMTYPWVSAQFQWALNPEAQRRVLLASFFREFPSVYMEFIGDDDVTIGYRKCKVAQVRATAGGDYTYGGVRYAPMTSGDAVYIEARTGFNDVDAWRATKVRLVSRAVLAPGIPAGRLWLHPGDIVSGPTFSETPFDLSMRLTVRDQVKILLRF
jgi:hypothetical protein